MYSKITLKKICFPQNLSCCDTE